MRPQRPCFSRTRGYLMALHQVKGSITAQKPVQSFPRAGLIGLIGFCGEI